MSIGKNITSRSLYKLSDRRGLLQRVYDALLADRDFSPTLTRSSSPEEYANWDARETVVRAMREFPVEEKEKHASIEVTGTTEGNDGIGTVEAAEETRGNESNES